MKSISSVILKVSLALILSACAKSENLPELRDGSKMKKLQRLATEYSVNNRELKIGDKMPKARGKTEEQNHEIYLDMMDLYQKGIIIVKYDSKDAELYLRCRNETILESMIKRYPFAIYESSGKFYYKDGDMNDKIDDILKVQSGEIKLNFDDAPSCENQI